MHPPPPPPINVSTILNRKKYSCKKNNNNKTPLSEFFFLLLFESGRPRPLFLSARRGWRGGGYYNIFIHTWARTILGFKILNFNTFEGFQKIEYFLGYEDFVDIFFGSSQNTKKLTPKMVRAYVCMKISEYPPPQPLLTQVRVCLEFVNNISGRHILCLGSLHR